MTTYTPGRYQARITDQGFEESAPKGTPYFFMSVQIQQRIDGTGNLPCPSYDARSANT